MSLPLGLQPFGQENMVRIMSVNSGLLALSQHKLSYVFWPPPPHIIPTLIPLSICQHTQGPEAPVCVLAT